MYKRSICVPQVLYAYILGFLCKKIENTNMRIGYICLSLQKSSQMNGTLLPAKAALSRGERIISPLALEKAFCKELS